MTVAAVWEVLLGVSPAPQDREATAFPASMQRIAHQRELAESGVRDVRQKATDLSKVKDAYDAIARDMNTWLDVVAMPLAKQAKADKAALREKAAVAARSLLTYINVAQRETGDSPALAVDDTRIQRVSKQLEEAGLEMWRNHKGSPDEIVRSLDASVRWRAWDEVQ